MIASCLAQRHSPAFPTFVDRVFNIYFAFLWNGMWVQGSLACAG